jgi:macrolide transport system ATP-binding/permease protein
MQLSLSHVTYCYPGSVNSVFSDISCTFANGWHAVIGANGCGKTTLARIISGELEPDEGTVTRGLVTALCAQDATAEPADLADFACDWSPLAQKVRRTLAIEDDWIWRYETLSSGQQKRVQIACALAAEPDVLILDEPTNHLDAPSRELLLETLRDFSGIGLLISHDRTLLDELATSCLCFEAGGIRMRPGNYSAVREQQMQEHDASLHARDAARREYRRLAQEQQRRREEVDRSAAKRSRRSLDPHDHDSREKIGRAIVSGKDRKAADKVRQLDQRMDGLSKKAGASVAQSYDGELPALGVRSKRNTVAHLDAQTIPFGDAGYGLEIPELFVGPDEHIAVVGPNGAGKSTLIKALVAEGIPDGVKAVYLPQELKAEETEELLGRLRGLDRAEQGAVLSLAAQLNAEPESYRTGSSVSPGELRKLALAFAALDGAELLVLDEPTNHLDVHAVEALERFLAGFAGALVLVSHDRHLVEAVSSAVWRTESLLPEGAKLLLS